MAAGVSAMGAIATGYIDPQLVAWAFQRADEVFDAPYEPFEGAIDTIIKYRDAGWHLVLCTKGDVEVQERKLALHNLRDLFAAIEITPVKSVDALRRICEQHGIDPLTAAYVGDSVRDDMTPAAHLGMTAIRVETQAEDMWTHEAIVDTVSHHVIPSLQHLPAVLPL
jgi:putative hydrolase of the HAD superfamily